MKKTFFQVLLGLFLLNAFAVSNAHAEIRVCAIGDSHVTQNSIFIRRLQEELGPEYVVIGHGRRGWTTSRWIRSGDFGRTCADYDVVLVSLGGNDIRIGHSWNRIYGNVRNLISQIPQGRVRIIYHMVVPRYYPGISLANDGVHLTNRGARQYARIVAPYLRF